MYLHCNKYVNHRFFRCSSPIARRKYFRNYFQFLFPVFFFFFFISLHLSRFLPLSLLLETRQYEIVRAQTKTSAQNLNVNVPIDLLNDSYDSSKCFIFLFFLVSAHEWNGRKIDFFYGKSFIFKINEPSLSRTNNKRNEFKRPFRWHRDRWCHFSSQEFHRFCRSFGSETEAIIQ